MNKVIYLYILKCHDGTFYTGVTNNLEKRILEHNTGTNPEAYTFSRRPVTLLWNEVFTNYNLAFEWETRIKKWSAKKKEALIAGAFNLLKQLSKKNFNRKI